MTAESIARKYLANVRGTGDNLRASCPFCSSKRAFIISKENGLYICFSCNETGHLAKLLYYLGLSRLQIDTILKKSELSFVAPRRLKKVRQLKDNYSTLPEYILSAYDTCPVSMIEAGFNMKHLSDNNIGYDRIKDRITFPIRDINGNLVGISGRACTSWAYPRYFHYEEDFQYVAEGYQVTNTDHLYGFHSIYPFRYFYEKSSTYSEELHRRIEEPIYVVEGYKGTLWLQQNGIDACGLQGSSMTPNQCKLISRIRSEIRIMLDYEYGKQIPDENGECKAIKIAKKLKNNRVTIVEYKGAEIGTSPDDLDKETISDLKANTVAQLLIHKEWRRK